MAEVTKECGNCEHYLRAENYRWGECCAPVPWFVHGEGFGVDFKVYESTAEDCDMFTDKKPG